VTRSDIRERVCVTDGCGKVFRGSNRCCAACRNVERVCVTAGCGKTFRGVNTKCAGCRSTKRTCSSDGCTNTFTGRVARCPTCQSTSKVCPDPCGKRFKGKGIRCGTCTASKRSCESCNTSFTGRTRKCDDCRKPSRVCSADGCGRTFRGFPLRCWDCRITDRVCTTEGCGRVFKGDQGRCSTCRFRSLPEDVQAALRRASRHAYRARKRKAAVAGPVPASVYLAIRSEGPCVYCGRASETVDHVVPLARGGWEHESNLVPACESCNLSKNARLLEDWDRDRVLHAVRVSPKVAAAFTRGRDESYWD
jgi:hypothetical protein